MNDTHSEQDIQSLVTRY